MPRTDSANEMGRVSLDAHLVERSATALRDVALALALAGAVLMPGLEFTLGLRGAGLAGAVVVVAMMLGLAGFATWFRGLGTERHWPCVLALGAAELGTGLGLGTVQVAMGIESPVFFPVTLLAALAGGVLVGPWPVRLALAFASLWMFSTGYVWVSPLPLEDPSVERMRAFSGLLMALSFVASTVRTRLLTQNFAEEQQLQAAVARATKDLIRLESRRTELRRGDRERAARQLEQCIGAEARAIDDALADETVMTPALAEGLSRRLFPLSAELSQLVSNLRLEPIERDGLTRALTDMANRACERNGLALRPALHPGADLSSAAVGSAIYAIVEEAIDNVTMHADARTLWLESSVVDSEVRLRVADDGRGFDTERAQAQGTGLLDMIERAAAVGGELRLDAVRGRGGAVELCVPLHAPTVASEAGA